MKNLTVQITDDVYHRAERRAAERGVTLPAEVADLVKRYSEEGTESPANGDALQRSSSQSHGVSASGDVSALLAALDKGRNTTTVGRLKRDNLYDRPVLH